MQTHDKRIWFPAKKYGWGWGSPCTWQGWVLVAGYVALSTVAALLLLPSRQVGLLIGAFTTLSIIFLVIVWLKGEKPRWRWGGD